MEIKYTWIGAQDPEFNSEWKRTTIFEWVLTYGKNSEDIPKMRINTKLKI